jgi:hypothetical protein
MSRRPVLAICTVAALGLATLISATPASAAPSTHTIAGVEITVCKVVTNERKGAATIFLDVLNTSAATATDDGTRRASATVSRTKGNGSLRTVSQWKVALAPGEAAGGSVKAQTGDEIAIGAGSAVGDAGAVYELTDLPTC